VAKTRTGLSGKEKAAMLLIALGPEASAQVMKHLREDEIEELTLEIANINKVDPEDKKKIIDEFYQLCVAQEYISEGGIEYAREVLEKALGTQRAIEIINSLTTSLQVKPFDFVRKTDPSQVLNFIQNEHPQTIALVLSYLRPDQAAVILSALPQDRQVDVAKRIARLNSASPEVIKEVERILEKKLSTLVSQDYTTTGGIQTIVDILNASDRSTEKNILDNLEVNDVELAEEIKNVCLCLRTLYIWTTGLYSEY
jgi:flagellar motor switch protein FliG